MIAYLDASALVKRYINERGSRETVTLMADSEMIATSIVSRAEVAAAFGKAARAGLLTHDTARTAQRAFRNDWPDLVRVPVTEALVERAEGVAWEYGLLGYDAVQLASALTWQESAGVEIVVATFDTELWTAATQAGLRSWPENVASSRRSPR